MKSVEENLESTQEKPNFLKEIFRFIWKVWFAISSMIGSFVLIIIILAIVLVSTSESNSSTLAHPSEVLYQGNQDETIAVVQVNGTILTDSNSSGFSDPSVTTSAELVPLIKSLASDKNINGMILQINSPGGSVVASEEIYLAVQNFAKTKPVIAQMTEVAASGGYYIAAAADEIIVNPATITGSIGVIGQFPEMSGLFEKVGVNLRTFKSGEFKDMGSPTKEFSPEEITIIDQMIDEAYQLFTLRISEGRDMDLAKVQNLGDGRIYTGNQAVKNGLADQLGNFDTAVSIINDQENLKNPHVVRFTGSSFIENLFGASVQKVFPEVAIAKQLNKITSQPGLYYLWGN